MFVQNKISQTNDLISYLNNHVFYLLHYLCWLKCSLSTEIVPLIKYFVFSSRNVSLNVAETVPAFCGNGTFHWSLPNGSANVTFLNYFLLRSVCITHSVFKVQEVTYGRGTLLNTKGELYESRNILVNPHGTIGIFTYM